MPIAVVGSFWHSTLIPVSLSPQSYVFPSPPLWAGPYDWFLANGIHHKWWDVPSVTRLQNTVTSIFSFLSLSLVLSRFWIPPFIFQAFQKSQGHITIPPSWRNPGLGMSEAFFRDNPRSPSNLSLSGLPVYTQMAFGKKKGFDPICLPILPGLWGQAFITTDK